MAGGIKLQGPLKSILAAVKACLVVVVHISTATVQYKTAVGSLQSLIAHLHDADRRLSTSSDECLMCGFTVQTPD